ncbi:hypothetical protein F5Y08DRAFT_354130 [Xylaria arbuscula]|nr:hypothetical protein F5Y08DRAFT_354130 [Xylaria arbuscula]
MGCTPEASTESKKMVCKPFKAHVFTAQCLDYPLNLESYETSVWDVLDDSSTGKLDDKKTAGAEWVWVHLPAVNREWVLELVQKMKKYNVIHNTISLLQIEEFVKNSFTNASGVQVAPQRLHQRAADIKAQRARKLSQVATQGEAHLDRGLKGPAPPVGESTSIKPGTKEDDVKDTSGGDLHSKFKEPVWTGNIESQLSKQEQFSRSEMFALALPYLDSHSDSGKSERLQHLRQHYGTFEGYPTKFLRDYNHQLSEVIFPRTLDQCYFSSAHETTHLDSDQVVYNYLKDLSEKWRTVQDKQVKMGNESALLTLLSSEEEIQPKYDERDKEKRLVTSPLRIWKIGHFVVSAFPDQEHATPSDSKFQELIYRSVWESCPISALDLVLDLAHIFIDFVDRPFNSGLSLSPLWIYERVIAEEAEKQVVRHNQFEEIMRDKREDKSELKDSTPRATRLVQNIGAKSERKNTTPDSKPFMTTAVTEVPEERDPLEGNKENDDHVLETKERKDPMDLITEEAESFKNVMDIRDELSMIESVVKEQDFAVRQLSNYLVMRGEPGKGLQATPSGNEPQDRSQSKAAAESDLNVQNLRQRMEDMVNRIQWRQSRIGGLDKRASMIEKGLNHLLDIKLKRSSLEEASDTKSVLEAMNLVVTNTDNLAKEGDKRAKQADKQSALISAFTVVTIWFTPLSFVTGFFAIPSKDFPLDSTQQDVNWSTWQIGVGLFVAFLLTLSFSGSVWAWYKRQDKDRKKEQSTSEIKGEGGKNLNEHEEGEKSKNGQKEQVSSSSRVPHETPSNPTPSQHPSPHPLPQRRSWPLGSRELVKYSLAHTRSKKPIVSDDSAMV